MFFAVSFLVGTVAIHALLVCKIFGPKIRSCKYFDKSQVWLNYEKAKGQLDVWKKRIGFLKLANVQKGAGMAETISAVHHLTHIVKPKREVVSPPSIFMIGFVKYWHRGNEIGNLDLWLHHHEKKDLGKFPSQLGSREHLSIRPQVFVRTFPFSSRVQPISIFVLKTCLLILFIIYVFKNQWH